MPRCLALAQVEMGGALEIYRGSPEQTPLLKNRTFRAVTQGGQGGDEGGTKELRCGG